MTVDAIGGVWNRAKGQPGSEEETVNTVRPRR